MRGEAPDVKRKNVKRKAERGDHEPLTLAMVTGDFYPDAYGGVHRVVYEVSKRLAQRGHTVHVVTRQVSPELPLRERLEGMEVWRFPVRDRTLVQFHATEILGARRTLAEVAAEGQIDVVNVHEVLPAVGAVLPRRAPVVWTLHAPWGEEWLDAFLHQRQHQAGPLARLAARLFAGYIERLERFTVRRSELALVLSEFIKGKLIETHRFPEERIRVVGGGVDLERFSPVDDRAALKRALGVGAGEWLVLTVRRLAPRMGVEALIEAACLLRRKRQDFRLVVVGDGVMRPQIEAAVERLDCGEFVKLAGRVPDDELPDYYRAADLFVLPTRFIEGFGMVTPESLASGTPVLGTPVGGTVELLRRFDPECLFADTRAETMAAKIDAFLSGDRLTAELRHRCRTFAAEQFDWACVVDRHEAAYGEAIAARG